MVPTRRLVVLAAMIALLAIVAGYWAPARPVLFALDALLVSGVAVDVLLAAGRRVDVERQVAAILSVGRPNVVALSLRNRSRRSLRGVVADDPLEACEAVGNPGPFALAGGGDATVVYQLVPSRRGTRALGGVSVRYPSILGLVSRQERALLPATVDVYPDVHAARSLELLRRQGRQDARLGSLRVRGGDTDFERLRPYQRGDELRHVDWRASARRDDIVVRQFQAESNQNVVFALDMGRGMRGEEGGGAAALGSLDHALNAVLLTADVALRAGDRAGLVAFDDRVRGFVPPAGGPSAGRRLTRALHAVDASLAATDFAGAMAFARTQIRARSLFVVFTQLLEPRSARDLAAAVKGLLPRHLPLCVLLRDVAVEALASSPVRGADDLFVRAAAAESLSWRDGIIRSLRGAGVLVLDVPPDALTPELVQRYLEIKSRRIL